MRRTFLAAILAFTAAAPLLAQAKPTSDDAAIKEVRELRDRWIHAEETKDIPFLRDLLADTAVVGNAQGNVLDKPHFLAVHSDPGRVLKELSAQDIEVHIYNHDTAVLTERIVIDGNDHGKKFGGPLRFVRIFVRTDGQWHVVLAQGTPIKPPTP